MWRLDLLIGNLSARSSVAGWILWVDRPELRDMVQSLLERQFGYPFEQIVNVMRVYEGGPLSAASRRALEDLQVRAEMGKRRAEEKALPSEESTGAPPRPAMPTRTVCMGISQAFQEH